MLNSFRFNLKETIYHFLFRLRLLNLLLFWFFDSPKVLISLLLMELFFFSSLLSFDRFALLSESLVLFRGLLKFLCPLVGFFFVGISSTSSAKGCLVTTGIFDLLVFECLLGKLFLRYYRMKLPDLNFLLYLFFQFYEHRFQLH